jgi:hypothetical protein
MEKAVTVAIQSYYSIKDSNFYVHSVAVTLKETFTVTIT